MDDHDASQLSDIESYLVNFNREISDDLPSSSNTSAFLYTTNTILSNGDDVYTELRSTVDSDKHLKGDGHGSEAGMIGTAAEARSEDQPAPLESAQAEAPFSTVTIMPSDLNTDGELQYMLILSKQEEAAGGSKEEAPSKAGPNKQNELSVFDFEEEANGTVEGEGQEGSDGSQDMYREEEDDEEEEYDDEEDEDYEEDDDDDAAGNVYRCNHCDYTSSKRFQLSRHLKSHSDERPHKCDYCSLAFKSRVALTNHTNTHKGVRPNKCKECEACFTTTGELIRHVRYRHTYEKPHRCTVCNYASVELSKLRRHVRSHTGERPYQCPHCPYASPDTFKLKRHLRVHTGERPYKCDICDMRFTQSNSLKSHRLIHTGARPIFKCELCPSTCTRKTDLRNHVLRIHTSDKPLLCRKCGKNFPDRYTYRIHSRTHDGQKCFKCELCPYSASVQRHLEHHIMTHTGERPYKCNLCHQAFRQKTLLRKHYTVAHNANSELALKQRAKIHVCPHCSRAFANGGSMAKHIKRLHGSEAEEEDDDEEEGGAIQTQTTRTTRGQAAKNGLKEAEESIEYLHMEVDNDDGDEEDGNNEDDDSACKVEPEEDKEEEEVKLPAQKKARLSREQNQENATPTGSTIKRRRGRPRKTPNAEKESDDDYVPKAAGSSSRVNGGTAPRRRGRPPKVRQIVVDVEDENEENYDNDDDNDETYNANNSRLIRRKAQDSPTSVHDRKDHYSHEGGFVYDEDEEADAGEDADEEMESLNGKV